VANSIKEGSIIMYCYSGILALLLFLTTSAIIDQSRKKASSCTIQTYEYQEHTGFWKKNPLQVCISKKTLSYYQPKMIP